LCVSLRIRCEMSKFGKDVGAVLDVWRDLLDTADNLFVSLPPGLAGLNCDCQYFECCVLQVSV
jgi:hypothetical protein